MSCCCCCLCKFSSALCLIISSIGICGCTGLGATATGAGVDTMEGGAGADVFKITTDTDSGITVALADTIKDFVTSSDTIDFSGAAGSAANYAEADGSGNANLAAVISDANGVFDGTKVYYAEYDVAGGGDGYLLFDADGDGTFNNTDVLVILTGVNFASEIAAADIIA